MSVGRRIEKLEAAGADVAAAVRTRMRFGTIPARLPSLTPRAIRLPLVRA